MKKVFMIIGIIIIVVVTIIGVFCFGENPKYDFDFIGSEWESNGEVISFDTDGSFAYYEYSGNAVGDYDLCDKYIYDKNTGRIHLSCSSLTTEIFSNFRVLDCDGRILTMRINGREKKFIKLVDYDYDFVNFWVGEDGDKVVYLKFWSDGTIEYSDSKLVTVEEFYKNDDYYNYDCGDFSRDDLNEVYEVRCPVYEDMGTNYVYDEKSKVITIFGVDSKKEMTMKIIESSKEKLIIEFENKTLEFMLY